MKKAVTILLLLSVALFALLADTLDPNTLILEAVITPIQPQYTLYAAESQEKLFSRFATENGSTIILDEDITENDITVYFRVVQSNTSVYDNENGVTISITPSELVKFSMDNEPMVFDENNKTGFPAHPDSITVYKVTNCEVSASFGNDSVATVEVEYDGKSVPEGATLASFYYTWEQDDTLENGQYRATIVMAVTGI